MSAAATPIADQVREAIAEHLGLCDAADRVTDAATFRALGADSLDGVELAMAIEDRFGIDVTDDEMEACETVGQCIALVERLVAERAA